MKTILFCITILCLFVALAYTQDRFDYMDVFNIEWVSEPQISPDGQKIVYVRNFSDIMTDQVYSNIWITNFDGSDNHPLTSGKQNDFSPRWSPDGTSFVYLSDKDKTLQIYQYRPLNGYETKLTSVNYGMENLLWSPDGNYIAFTSFVEESQDPLVNLPAPPAGAHWSSPPQLIHQFIFRFDGAGYTKSGNEQVFILPKEGGTPYRVTDLNYGTPISYCWSADAQWIYISASGLKNGDFEEENYNIYNIYKAGIKEKSIKQITARDGPDVFPAASPDGKYVAYTGYDDKVQMYQALNLYVMNSDGSSQRQVITSLDRDVNDIKWSIDSKGIYFSYDDKGNTLLAYSDLKGNVQKLAENIGGLSLDRPYSGGSFTIAANGRFAFTLCGPDHPADLACGETGGREIKRLTNVNDDIFRFKPLGKIEEIWFKSSFDNRNIQGWIVYPPDYDPPKKYPLILEIHGGPNACYGPRYATEMQLYASHGYVVLYTNPRGSTGYGTEFGNLLFKNYPGNDYDDLMSGVDYVIKKGIADENNLFVTGGSSGGTLSAWIIGHTNRFKAAVLAKPITNLYSMVLYGDLPDFIPQYWMGAFPWDEPEFYMKYSPISYVKNVKTPAMLLTGEYDYRTPIAEIEQYYTALKINNVETVMLRILGAGHHLTARPANQVYKAMYTIGWFDWYRDKGRGTSRGERSESKE